MTCQFGKGGRRDGNVTFQQIQRQFADGVDLIRVGMLQQRLTGMATTLAQHLLEKRSLSPYPFHGNPPTHNDATVPFTVFYCLQYPREVSLTWACFGRDSTTWFSCSKNARSPGALSCSATPTAVSFPPHVSNERPQRHVLFSSVSLFDP